MHHCLTIQPGLVDYETGLVFQANARSLVENGETDGVLILLQHQPVITHGRSGGAENLLADPIWLSRRGVTVTASDRGGNITCHNPGQLVGYPIFNLTRWRQDVHWYVETLEEAIIRTLALYGLTAGRKAKYTGVWLGDEKIAAIGVSVRRWMTGHGFALNIDNDLSLFSAIVPCGIDGFGVTSLRQAGVTATLPEVAAALTSSLAAVFECTLTPAKGGA